MKYIKKIKNKLLSYYCKILAICAKHYIKKHKPIIIGINGSVGKTSCRDILNQTLKKLIPQKTIYTSSKNFNGELGMSLSIFQIENFLPNLGHFIYTFFYVLDMTFINNKKPYDIIILEYGIDTPGEMDFLLNITNPDIGIFTAIDPVHSEQFGNPEAIAQEEIKMIQNTKEIVFLNYDDLYARKLSNKIKIEKFTYHTQYDNSADIFFDKEVLLLEDKMYSTFQLNIKEQKIKIKTNLIGKSHYGYIGLSIAIAEILYYRFYNQTKIKDIQAITLEYQLQYGRFSIFPGIQKNIIIDSSYNASPSSVKNIIDISYRIKKSLYPHHKLILLFGDMRELGDLSEQEHRQIVSHIQAVADHIFLVGEMTHKYTYDELGKIGFDMNFVQSSLSSISAGKNIKELLNSSQEKYIIICKGSQNTIFIEEGIKQILLNESDHNRLPRQSKRRLNKKQKFFDSVK